MSDHDYTMADAVEAAKLRDQCSAAAKHRWTIRGLDWEYDTRWPRFRRWGVSDGCRGVGGRLNPLTAYVALLRWRGVPARPE